MDDERARKILAEGARQRVPAELLAELVAGELELGAALQELPRLGAAAAAERQREIEAAAAGVVGLPPDLLTHLIVSELPKTAALAALEEFRTTGHYARNGCCWGE